MTWHVPYIVIKPFGTYHGLLVFFGFLSFFSKAQASVASDTIKHLTVEDRLSIPGKFSFATIDRIGNIYAITTSGRFVKYSPAGDSLAAFNEVVRFGRPQYADVSNPFKVLLVYQRIPALILLDRQLTFQGNILFQQKGLTNVAMLSSSYDNRIWLFDQQQFTIRKYNEEFELITESADTRQLTGETIQPQKIVEQKNNLWLYDSSRGFFCFDLYGHFKNQLPFIGWKDVGCTDEFIFGRSADTLHFYDRSRFYSDDYLLPEKSDEIASIQISNNMLLIRKAEALKTYRMVTSGF